MKLCFAILTLTACIAATWAQYDGPLPPRPEFAGASPVGNARPAFRRRPIARILDEPLQRRPSGRGASPRRIPTSLLDQPVQARPSPSSRDYDDFPSRRQNLRPSARRYPSAPEQPLLNRQSRPLYQESPIAVVRPPVLSQPQPQHLSTRPVVEEEEEEEEEEDQPLSTFAAPSPTPQVISSQLPTLPPPQPSPQLFSNLDDFPVPTRQQYRPQPPPEEEPQQTFVRQPRPQPSPPVRLQQQVEPVRQEPARPKPYAQQQYNRQQQVARPVQKEVAHTKASESDQHHTNRPRKPTSQVLKKYREDNPDGSITWGYENDDGSFKEETIGIDCVTRGKYGYIDPDGVRREFSYNSGIPCDRSQQQDSDSQASEGYIDYTNNKYVFPNGESIDLNSMVRNRARKPVAYRN